MKLHHAHGVRVNKGLWGIERAIRTPCTEDDILYLEEICMEAGVHHITVTTYKEGRAIVSMILRALAWHQNIAWLPSGQVINNLSIANNIALHLDQLHTEEDFETFFTQTFGFDCLVIEKTAELSARPWFFNFEKYIEHYGIAQHIPIIVMIT